MRIMRVWRSPIIWFHGLLLALKAVGFRSLFVRVFLHIKRGGLTELFAVARVFLITRGVLNDRAVFEIGSESHEKEWIRSFTDLDGDATEIRLRLPFNREISERTWREFLRRIYDCHLATLNKINSSKLSLVVIVDCQDQGWSADEFVRTQSSIKTLVDHGAGFVRACWRCEGNVTSSVNISDVVIHSHLDLLRELHPEEYVLWIKPGDEPHTEIVEILACKSDKPFELLLIDLYRVESEVAHPILMNGIDPVLATGGCYFFGRFITRGRHVLAAIKRNPLFKPEDLGCELIRQQLPGLEHIPIPLIKINLTNSEFKAIRQSFSSRGEYVAANNSVSAIICTKNSGLLLEQLIRQLLLNPLIREVVVVANNPTNEYALSFLEKTIERPRCMVLNFSEEFNFSKQSNLGAKNATGEFFLFINDDIAPVTDDWLEQLMSWMNGNRIVGPLLIYPDQTIQHAGMFMGYNGVAGHALRGGEMPDADPDLMLAAARRVSALTGAVMLMSRQMFEDLNGFDVMLGTYLQDVDLCLRAQALDVELVFDPRAVLIHMESVSIKPTLANSRIQRRRKLEFEYYLARWGEQRLVDPYINPLISRSDESLGLLCYENK